MSNPRRMNELFHTLWGKAHDGPDYDKKEWIEFQKLLEKSEISDLLAWMKARPGASWVATIKDVKKALMEMKEMNN